MSKTRFLTTIGLDDYQVPVVRGLFALCSTVGLPLADAIAYVHARGHSPDYLHLLTEMIDEGNIKPDRARRALEAAIADAALMPDVRDETLRRLAHCLERSPCS